VPLSRIQRRIAEKSLRIHGWWFDIGRAEVLYWNESERRFGLINEKVLETL
jgi:carbonic anhydrase